MGILLLLIAGALIWYFAFYRNKAGSNATSASLEEAAGPVLDEAIEIVNDFLEYGRMVEIFSDTSFDGAIIFMRDARPPFSGSRINYGFSVDLLDVDQDLSVGAAKYPRVLANNPEIAEQYDEFMEKYGDCYVPEEKRYVYLTRHTVALRKGQDAQLQQLLRKRIEQECPLATAVNAGHLHNKNVPY